MRRRTTWIMAGGAVLALGGALLAVKHDSPSDRRAEAPPAVTAAHVNQTQPVSARRLNARVPVPILMYHVIAEPQGDVSLPELFVSPADFVGQMAWLGRHGFHAVTLRAVWNSWHGGGRLPSRPIVISFDDGYRSAVGTALPTLASHGWAGVLNLTVSHVGPSGLRVRGVRRLIRAGWEIGAHSMTHPDLTALGGSALEREVAGSRSAIRRLFDVPVDFFCYPSGRYNAAVIDAVRRAGYLGATTTEDGLARVSEPYTLDRVRINGSDGVRGFAAKIARLTS